LISDSLCLMLQRRCFLVFVTQQKQTYDEREFLVLFLNCLLSNRNRVSDKRDLTVDSKDAVSLSLLIQNLEFARMISLT
jgi:hypothetical protein